MKLSEAYFKPIGWVMNKARYPVLRVILASFICFFVCLYVCLYCPVVGIIEFTVRTIPDFFADIWDASKTLLKDAWHGDWS